MVRMGAKATNYVLVVLAAVVLGWLLFVWMGGGGSGSFLGQRLGPYTPPIPPPGRHEAVLAEGVLRDLSIGEPNPFKEFLGYRNKTDIAVYRGEWSAKREGQDVTVAIELESEAGKWRVVRWDEN